MSFGFLLKLLLLFIILSLLFIALRSVHPLALALNLILVCFFLSCILIKLTFSWLFYLLILMFLGGIIVVVIYMASLAANEKILPFNRLPLRVPLATFISILFVLDENSFFKLSSTFSFSGDLLGVYFSPVLVSCFGILLLAMVRAVNLIKLEEGPLVKRL